MRILRRPIRCLFLVATLCVGMPAVAATRAENTAVRAPSATITTRAAAPQKQVQSRTAVSASAPTAARATTARSAASLAVKSNSRAATSRTAARTASVPNRAATARAATNLAASASQNYNSCRDIYFNCMDQFCGYADETYRRCVCSSRLEELKNSERVLSQTNQQLQDFQMLNIDAITKTSAEVKAMSSATAGELAMRKDTSASAKKLEGISSILKGTQSSALSNAGQLDAGGSILQIWNTTDFIGGSDISNLSGEKLYNRVHEQCWEAMASQCGGSQSAMSMVSSAYGMLIEQDCNALIKAVNNKNSEGLATIRSAEREMNLARLENYDSHNYSQINQCVVKVRTDLTGDAACGQDFVRCLDITGLYLNVTTGEPIYTPKFYQLDNQINLDGDILKLSTNQLLLKELNNKKMFADKSLDTCRDISNEVWDEFLRQAVIEIYQGQQKRIRQVKDECITVVNQCYDRTTSSLRDFSNGDKQSLLGQRVETTEAMCRDKMDACSNLYGGGAAGLAELLRFVYNVQTAIVSDDCEASLNTMVHNLCGMALERNYPYPYSCRIRLPGSYDWQKKFLNDILNDPEKKDKMCIVNNGTTLRSDPGQSEDQDEEPEITPVSTECEECKLQQTSIYYDIYKYARENCTRPSVGFCDEVPTAVQTAVNRTFDKLRSEMSTVLSQICADNSGDWLQKDAPQEDCCYADGKCDHNVDKDPNFEKECTGEYKSWANKIFYDKTSANKKWGICEDAFCYQVGDMFYQGGYKMCCEAGQVYNSVMGICVIAQCPISSTPVNSGCTNWESDLGRKDALGNILVRGKMGGCAAINCQCQSDYMPFLLSSGQVVCEPITCDDPNSSYSDECSTGQSQDNENEGCVALYCRCNPGFVSSVLSSGGNGQSAIMMCVNPNDTDCSDGSVPDSTCLSSGALYKRGECFYKKYCRCPAPSFMSIDMSATSVRTICTTDRGCSATQTQKEIDGIVQCVDNIELCPVGQYSASGNSQTQCKSCPDNGLTLGEGSTSIEQCYKTGMDNPADSSQKNCTCKWKNGTAGYTDCTDCDPPPDPDPDPDPDANP